MDHYNENIAYHYRAYRPPLHKIILKRHLTNLSHFSDGLDIGCGTGRSTIALSQFCEEVVGIDPNQSMLNRAAEHPGINYRKGSGEEIPLPDNSVDIVTLAGSLFYMNREKVASEIQRVCRKKGVVFVYDFEILLDDILSYFNINKEDTNPDYDHQINFSGIDFFEEINSTQDQINLHLSPSELAHILLSDHFLFKAVSEKFATQSPFERVKNEIKTSDGSIKVQADIFYSLYHIV